MSHMWMSYATGMSHANIWMSNVTRVDGHIQRMQGGEDV